ncbi:MAG TPA: hypothetical protein VFI25_18435 [Planctomycetota bacterium]|jgi:hypothetical protein|nr:hypothetical protein [Planctomycetota bacterium]
MRPPAPVAPLLAAARAFHRRVLRAVASSRLDPDGAAREGVGDLSFPIDDLAEEALEALGREVGSICPALLVAEGLGEKRFGRGGPRLRVIVDPVDGSRERTHRLGSAWALVGFAREQGGGARARDFFLALQGEIPLPHSPTLRVLGAERGRGAWEEVRHAGTGRLRSRRRYRADARARPGAGFHVFAAFGAADRTPLARVQDRFHEGLRRRFGTDFRAIGDWMAGPTARLLLDATEGRLRMAADLRPLFPRSIRATAKPYDLAALLVPLEAGGIVTSPDGRPLDFPLDLDSGVAFVAYPNRRVCSGLEPLLRRALRSVHASRSSRQGSAAFE